MCHAAIKVLLHLNRKCWKPRLIWLNYKFIRVLNNNYWLLIPCFSNTFSVVNMVESWLIFWTVTLMGPMGSLLDQLHLHQSLGRISQRLWFCTIYQHCGLSGLNICSDWARLQCFELHSVSTLGPAQLLEHSCYFSNTVPSSMVWSRDPVNRIFSALEGFF